MKWQFILILLFSFSAKAESQAPFAWTVEKDGKSSTILGTIHVGLPLNEILCSNKISQKIKNSQLLFIEEETQSDIDNLSEEEQKKLFIGSDKEKTEIMSRLSLKSQDIIRERKGALTNILKELFSHRYESASQTNFNNFSQSNQTFLINQGAHTTESYASLFYFINTIAYYRAYYSLPSLDKQVKQIALSHSVEIKSLDDNNRLNQDFKLLSYFNKPIIFVGYKDVKDLIKNIDNLTKLFQKILLNKVPLYKMYDIDFFNSATAKEIEGLDTQALLKNRNQLWLEKFLTAHKKHGNIFLSAGLTHFIGEYALLDSLKKEGFSVERITCSSPIDSKL